MVFILQVEVLLLLFAFSVELLILFDVHGVQTCFLHFLNVLNAFLAHQILPDGFLVGNSLQGSLFESVLRPSIILLVFFSCCAPIARVDLQLTNSFIIHFVDIISLFSLKFHLVDFFQLCIEALLRANVSEVTIDLILVSKLFVKSISVILDSLIVAIRFLADIILHFMIVLHAISSFTVTLSLQ